MRLGPRLVQAPSGEQWRVGRTLLGRPWVVQAMPMQDGAEALAWRVVGWRRSTRLIDEVAGSLGLGLRPSPAEGQELGDAGARAAH